MMVSLKLRALEAYDLSKQDEEAIKYKKKAALLRKALSSIIEVPESELIPYKIRDDAFINYDYFLFSWRDDSVVLGTFCDNCRLFMYKKIENLVDIGDYIRNHSNKRVCDSCALGGKDA